MKESVHKIVGEVWNFGIAFDFVASWLDCLTNDNLGHFDKFDKVAVINLHF